MVKLSGTALYGGLFSDVDQGPIAVDATPVIVTAEGSLTGQGIATVPAAGSMEPLAPGDFYTSVNFTYSIAQAGILNFQAFINGIAAGVPATVESAAAIDFNTVAFQAINTFTAGLVIDVRMFTNGATEQITIRRYRALLFDLSSAVVAAPP